MEIKDEDKYRIYRQMINSFYEEEQGNQETVKFDGEKVKLEPILIYKQNYKELRLQFKIGNKQMYKIRNLADFYDKMHTNSKYKYGLKLEFVHCEEAFEKESIPILNFVMKYAEMIKYMNESEENFYSHTVNNSYIVLTNTGIDEFFEIMKGKEVEVETEYATKKVEFVENEPEIEFKIVNKDEQDYALTTSEDIFGYHIIRGKNNIYFFRDNKFYKCSFEFEQNTLKLLNVFRLNFTKEIILKKEEFADFYSLVIPKLNNKIDTNDINPEELEIYKPKELKVKVYLDYTTNGFITADVKFEYEDIEFSPFEEVNQKVARNAIAESRALDKFKRSGFMINSDKKLVLVEDEFIFDFLNEGIGEYISEFEVLATDEFRKKQVKIPRIGSIGVKIENNLLNVDLSGIDLNENDIEEIMKRYKLKKRFYKLTNGDFIDLTQNETLDMLESLSEGTNTNYKELISGNLKLPIYRSLYLNNILKKHNLLVKQSSDYKNLVGNIYNRQISVDLKLPVNLKAELREYQKVGYEWLNNLDEYNLGRNFSR